MFKKEILNPKMIYKSSVESENHLKFSFVDVPIGIFHSSPEGKLYDVNKKLVDILGYESTEELILTVNETDLECIYVDKENRSKFVEEAIKDNSWHSHEDKFYRKDGNIIVAELSFKAVKNSNGSVKHLEGFMRDITNYKNIENELKEIKQNYGDLFNSSPNYIIFLGLNGNLIHVNKAACDVVGLSAEELIGKNFKELDFLLDEELPLRLKNLSQVLKENKTKIRESRFIDKNGETRHIESFLIPLKSDDEIIGFNVICNDITKRKKAEKTLKQSELYYKTIFENTGAATFIFDENTIISLVNTECEKLSGYCKEEIEGKSWIDFVAGDDRERLINYYLTKKDSNSSPKNYEFNLVNKWGDILHFYANIVSIPGTNSRLASLLDITERKRVEESLKESENRYRKLLENSFDAVFIHDGNKFISANNIAMKILCVKNPEELSGKPVRDIIHPEYYEIAKKRMQILEVEGKLPPLKEKFLRADGTSVDVEVLAVEFIYEGEKAFQAVFRDITAYKLVEKQKNGLIKELKQFTKHLEVTNKKLESTTQELQQKGEKLNFINQILKEREEQLKLFIEYAPADIAMFDNNMNYISTSKRWITDYDLEGQEIIGRSHYEVSPGITDELKEVHKRCLTGASERCEEDMLIRPDGSIMWVKWEVIPWYLLSGSIGGIVIFSEDITENKIAEKNIKASLQEKEVLLREIHHRVKNNLQIISSLLALQTNYVDNNETKNVLYESQNRIKSMAIIHEMLYQSDDLATINLSNYIKDLIHDLFYCYGAKSNIKLIIDAEETFLNIETAIPCGLIISELVSNSLKYAFPDSKSGKIFISVYSRDEEFKLIISDDGIGLPENIDFKNVDASLGLRLVNMLVNQLDGSIELDKTGGTKFIIRFKELEYEKRF